MDEILHVGQLVMCVEPYNVNNDPRWTLPYKSVFEIKSFLRSHLTNRADAHIALKGAPQAGYYRATRFITIPQEPDD